MQLFHPCPLVGDGRLILLALWRCILYLFCWDDAKSPHRARKVVRAMTSKTEEGQGTSKKDPLDLKELAKQLPCTTGEDWKRKEPTEEDFRRYEQYVGQKWTGVCKWFNVSKGFGFIVPDEDEAKHHNDDVFVHQSSLQMPGFRSLDEGEEVEFTIRLGKRGLEAENVNGIGGAPLRGSKIHPLGKRKEKEIRCFNCGQFGHHKAFKCKRPPQESKSCYVCNSSEHLAADCPKRAHREPPSGSRRGPSRTGGTTKE